MSIRVLIVDDSPTIRRMIKVRLQKDPRTIVVGESGNANEARNAIKALNPDVLTLDVEMPGMNGLDFLEKLMKLRPMPVVMVSSETKQGSERALEALTLGAVECIGKPFGGGLSEAFDRLPDLICAAAEVRPRAEHKRGTSIPAGDFSWNGKFVVLGASTGGVEALQTLLYGYPDNCPPTIIAQHMPPAFIASFVRRLASKMAPRVILAGDGMPLLQGTVLIAPGGDTHIEICQSDTLMCRLVDAGGESGFKPSIDVLFRSAAPFARNAVAALLTGMGRDGAAGLLALRNAGARCLAQDRASSVIYGMPRAAMEVGAAERQVAIGQMSAAILDLCSGPIAQNGGIALSF